MPPLYYFLLHFWMILGRDIWIIRLLNVILSLLLVWAVIQWTTKMFGNRIGILAGIFTAISPFQIYHAQEIRMYTLLCLTLAGYIISFYLNEQAPANGKPEKKGLWIAFVACGAAAMYSHNLAVFTILVPDIYLVMKRNWKFLRKTVIWQSIILLAALPWLLQIPGQISKIQTAFWTPRPGIVEIIQAILTFQVTLPLPTWAFVIAAIVSIQVLVILCLEIFRKYRSDSRIQFLLVLWLFPSSAMFIVSYIMRPIYVPRAFILSSVAFYILAAVVIGKMAGESFRKPSFTWFILGLWLAVVAISLPYQYTFAEFPRSPYQKATEYLAAQVSPGEKIIHDNKISYFPSHYYAPALNQSFLADIPGSSNDSLAPASQSAMGLYPEKDISSAVGNASQIYFVVYQKAIDEYLEMGRSDHPVIQWLAAHFHKKSEMRFNDLIVQEYVR